MIWLILISGAYFYIGGVITTAIWDNRDLFSLKVSCIFFGLLWLPIHILLFILFLLVKTIESFKTCSNDNKHKLQNEGDNL